MQNKVCVEVNNLTVSSSANFQRERVSPSLDQTDLVYLRNINLKFQSGDKVLLVDANNVSKLALIRVLGKQVFPSEGTVSISGKVFPGLSPSFGILPKATLHQNAILRGLKLGYDRQGVKDYYKTIFEDNDLAKFKGSSYLDIGSELRTLFLLQSLEPLEPHVLFLENWINSSSEILRARCKDLFAKMVTESTIAVLAINQVKLGLNVRNKEVIFENKTVQSTLDVPFV